MIKKFFPSIDLFRNISTLVVGTFLAQLVPMLLQSILRRMYPAEDFSVFAVFISITGILMVVASLRYEMAVVLPRKKSDAINLVFIGLFAAFLFSLLLLVLIFFFSGFILSLINVDNQYRFMLYYLPLATFMFSSYQVINYYLVRYKLYKEISVNKISRRITEGAGQILFGMGGWFSSGLIWGNVAGHLANVITGWIQMVKSGFDIRLFSLKQQWHLMKKYRQFPVYNLIPAFLNALCMHLPILFVNKFYAQDTAYFDLARQVLVLPASILTLSISQVLLQAISEKSRQSLSFKGDLKRILLLLTLMATAMTIIILFWAPQLFALYAGPDYYLSGIYARIIVVGAALKLIVSPVSSILVALNKIKWLSFWQAFYFLAITTLLLFSHLDIMNFLKIYLIIDILAYGVLFIMIWIVSKKYEKELTNSN